MDANQNESSQANPQISPSLPPFVSFSPTGSSLPSSQNMSPSPLVIQHPANQFPSPMVPAGASPLPPGFAYPAMQAAWQFHSVPPNVYPISDSQQVAIPPLQSPPSAINSGTPTQQNGSGARKSKASPKRRKNTKKKNNANDEEGSRTDGSTRTQKKQMTWINDRNKDGKSSLDLVVEWMTTGENYELWRGGTKSKRDVAIKVVQFLEDNGVYGRDARGVEQQINKLESKYRNAADWRAQTGQGIEDEMEADRAQLSDDSTATNIAELRREAFHKIDVELRRRCYYFFDLDPVISGRASARPLYARDQTNTENPQELDDIFGTGAGGNNNQADDDTGRRTPPGSCELNDEEWPYSPSQLSGNRIPSTSQCNAPTSTHSTDLDLGAGSLGVSANVVGMESEGASVGSGGGNAARKRKHSADNQSRQSQPAGGLDKSNSSTSLSRASSNIGSLQNHETGRKTNKVATINTLLDVHTKRYESQQNEGNAISHSIVRTLESLSNNLTGGAVVDPEHKDLQLEKLRLEVHEKKLEVQEREIGVLERQEKLKGSSLARKVQIFKDLMSTGLSKEEALQMTEDLLREEQSGS